MGRQARHFGVGKAPPRVLEDVRPCGLDIAQVEITYQAFVRLAVHHATQLCSRAQVDPQASFLEGAATRARFRAEVVDAGSRVGPGGLLVVSFAGHGRDGADGDNGWLLADGLLREADLSEILDEVPPTTKVILISDHCYGLGALWPPSTQRARPQIVISAVDERGIRVPTSTTLALLIERAAFDPVAASVRDMTTRLLADPKGLLPEVWASQDALLDLPLF